MSAEEPEEMFFISVLEKAAYTCMLNMMHGTVHVDMQRLEVSVQ